MSQPSIPWTSPHLPLESLVLSRCTRCALEFPRGLAHALRQNADLRFESLGEGTRMYAADEESFANAARLIGKLYGACLEVAPPEIRVMPGPPPRHPIMAVRISARAEDAPGVRDDLARRKVQLAEENWSRRYFAVRGVAPMAALLGLPGTLAELTGGTAVHWIRLSHYEAREPRATLLG